MSSLPWIDIAESLVGTNEIPGPYSNPVIVNWAKEIGGFPAKYYKNDDTPWCALFVSYCLKKAGCSVDIENPLWVPNFNSWGTHCRPVYGCVMNFGYHIAFYIAEDHDHYFVLGGNQSNTVNLTRIPKSNLKRASWPSEKLELLVDGPVFL